MKRKIFLAGLCTALLTPIPVSAQVLDYDGIVDKYKQENKALQRFLLDDGAGGTVTALADAEDFLQECPDTFQARRDRRCA